MARGKKPFNWRMWSKVGVVTVIFGVGGPMFTAWISPTEDELRAKYNPDLRRRSLEQGDQRQEEFDQFVTKLKEWSKSDKPIWEVAREAEEVERAKAIARAKAQSKEKEARRLEIQREAGIGSLQTQADAAPPEPKQGGGWFSWFGGK